MTEPAYDETAIERSKELPMRRPPWQLLMVANTERPLHLTADTNNALMGIFDLLPDLRGVTIKTTKGDLSVSRDFPSGYTDTVDSLLAAVFKNDPDITGIVFPATATRAEHTATPDDPHFLPQGKALAAITAAHNAGEIDSQEAIRRIKAILAKE